MGFWNLSAPLAPHRRLGTESPWDTPYLEEDIATIEVNDAHLIHIEMGSDTGTRLLTRRMFETGAVPVDRIGIGDVTDLPGVCVTLRADDGVIDAAAIDQLLADLDRLGGEPVALVLWDGSSGGVASFDPTLAESLARTLRSRGIRMLLTDLERLDPPARTAVLREWRSEVAWKRPPWPSGTAKQYLRYYAREDARADFASTSAFTAELLVVAGLRRADELPESGFLVTALPMFVRDAGSAPCTVTCRNEARKELT